MIISARQIESCPESESSGGCEGANYCKVGYAQASHNKTRGAVLRDRYKVLCK